MTCFVGFNHAHNVVTWSLHTVVLIYEMKAPIFWLSKNQSTVDSSKLGYELAAMRTVRDIIVAIRYKLRIFGVPLDGPSNVIWSATQACLNLLWVRNKMH